MSYVAIVVVVQKPGTEVVDDINVTVRYCDTCRRWGRTGATHVCGESWHERLDELLAALASERLDLTGSESSKTGSTPMTISQRRHYLTSAEQRALLSACQGLFVRDHALFTLALGAGLSGRSINALDTRHISDDGERVRERLDLVQPDGRIFAANDNCTVPLSEHVRLVLGWYLKWRKGLCRHFQLPMQTYRDAAGVERCASCQHRVDLMTLPLFTSRLHERLSVRRMRSLFAAYRDELKMPKHLHFDSLRGTFQARRVADLRAA